MSLPVVNAQGFMMAVIDPKLVKELRERTQAGMMDCKKALAETAGDLERASDYLRKLGLSAMAKRAGRVAAEGVISITTAPEGTSASLVEINSETDFVARNEDFLRFAHEVALLVLQKNIPDRDALLAHAYPGGVQAGTVAEVLATLTAKIGEKISLRRIGRYEVGAGEVLGHYLHTGAKIGVLVVLRDVRDQSLAKDIAMHIAACSPLVVDGSQLDAAILDRERAIALEQLQDSDKGADIKTRIVAGKLAKFAQDVALNDQVFVKDPAGKMTVKAWLKSHGGGRILRFIRFQVGEGIDRRQNDFAQEVAQQISH